MPFSRLLLYGLLFGVHPVLLFPQGQPESPCVRPLSEDAIKTLLEARVADDRIRPLIDKCSIGFVMTPEIESRLRAAGATEPLLKALRGASAGNLPTPAASPQARPADLDLAFWNSISGMNDRELYEEYLHRFPDGAFAAIARRRLGVPAGDAPKTEAPAAAATPDEVAGLRKTVPALIEAGRWKEATQAVDRILKLAPSDPEALDWRKATTPILAMRAWFPHGLRAAEGTLWIRRGAVGFDASSETDAQYSFQASLSTLKNSKPDAGSADNRVVLEFFSGKKQPIIVDTRLDIAIWQTEISRVIGRRK